MKYMLWPNDIQGRWGIHQGRGETPPNQWSAETGLAAIRVSRVQSARQDSRHHLGLRYSSLNSDILSGDSAGVQTLQSLQHNCQWYQSGGRRGDRSGCCSWLQSHTNLKSWWWWVSTQYCLIILEEHFATNNNIYCILYIALTTNWQPPLATCWHLAFCY